MVLPKVHTHAISICIVCIREYLYSISIVGTPWYSYSVYIFTVHTRSLPEVGSIDWTITYMYTDK